MKNLKISKKLLVTFGVIIILFIITISISIFSLFSSGNRFEEFYSEGYPVSVKTTEMRASMQSGLKFLSQAMLTDDIKSSQSFISQAETEFASVDEGFVFLEQNFQGDKSSLTETKTILDNSKTYRDQILKLAGENKNDEAKAILFDTFQPMMVEFTTNMKDIDNLTTQMADESYAESEASMVSTTILLAVISAVALLSTIFMALYITRGITGPTSELDYAANEMAKGNLKIDVKYTSKDEMGSLANSMRTMSEKISYYMGEISSAMEQLANGDLNVRSREDFLGDFKPVQDSIRALVTSLNYTFKQMNLSSEQVAGGSDQVASGAQALSQGATEQASSVEELAATINEISQQVQNTAQNAEDAMRQTNNASEKVGLCNQQMQHMIAAMGEISDKSSEIGKIIKTIEDISFQTNILALNAAVEAARAGAAGKGFAVVADEVRNLANKSAEASKNTSALIEASIQAVENGTAIANETAQSLLQVVEDTGAVSASVDKISTATNEQANSIAQVTQGVDQISSVVQINSATAEESAAASEELSGQAQMLKDLVSKFKLKETDDQPAGMPKAEAHTYTEERVKSFDTSKY